MTPEEERFFIDANLEGEPVEVSSPSGSYRLTIQRYRTRPGCWSYSRGGVTRVADGHVVADIKRNYHAFHHTFVVKDGREYLITGRSYMSQTIIDLDAGLELDAPQEGFCWARCELSPDGRTLLVDGCIWACPYELRFFDFTDPSRGWPELPLIGIECLEERDLDPAPRWVDAVTVECHLWDGGERVTLRRDGDAMRVVERWISNAEQRRRDDEARADAEYDARGEAFRASDPIYLRLVELAGEMPLLRERIAEGPDQVWFRFRSSKAKATADLRWKRDRGPLSVVTYVDGRTHGELEFPWSIVGIEDAVRAIATTLT